MKHPVLVFALILWIVECIGCAPRPAKQPPAPARCTAATQPAPPPQLPYWIYLRLRYPHRTMESPFATPRDFEEQA